MTWSYHKNWTLALLARFLPLDKLGVEMTLVSLARFAPAISRGKLPSWQICYTLLTCIWSSNRLYKSCCVRGQSLVEFRSTSKTLGERLPVRCVGSESSPTWILRVKYTRRNTAQREGIILKRKFYRGKPRILRGLSFSGILKKLA